VRLARFLFCTLFSASMALAAQAQLPRLLVAQKGDSSLAIVDPAEGKVLASVAEGGITGHEVIASRDGRTAYVPIYGNSGVGKPGSSPSTSTLKRSWVRSISTMACVRTARSSAPKTGCST
jgi:hypothetical protein